ncbi:MAG: hypothetical protein WA945_01900, partial [Arcobacteraceae bacterium]
RDNRVRESNCDTKSKYQKYQCRRVGEQMKRDRKRKASSNYTKILNYLLTGKSLTRVQAIKMEFGMDLSTRVSELRAEGVKIEDEYIDDEKRQKKYQMSHLSIEEYKQSTTSKQDA